MYLVDTDIIIWIIRGEKKYVQWFDDLKEGTVLSISSISIAEIYKNVFPSELENTQDILNKFKVWDVTAIVAKRGGLYWQHYEKKLKALHIFDCIIAATAKEYNLSVLTLNTRHFPMSDIRVVDPGKKS